jgi:hypothetical protein
MQQYYFPTIDQRLTLEQEQLCQSIRYGCREMNSFSFESINLSNLAKNDKLLHQCRQTSFLEVDSTLMSFIKPTNFTIVLIKKNYNYEKLIFMGGTTYMAILTILLIITTVWFIYHFIIAYKSEQTNPEKLLRKFGYGKSLGLFTMIVGITGQMNGLYAMFAAIEDAIKKGVEVNPALVVGAIKVTMICTFYGIFIYLFSLILWFVASILIERRLEKEQK